MPWTPAIACGSCKIPPHLHPQTPRSESHFQGVRSSKNRSPGPRDSSFRTRSAFPTLSKARSGQNRQSVFLGRLLERFAERREDAGPRGGRRQTKHQGRVDTEVAEVGGGTCLVAGHHLLWQMRRTDGTRPEWRGGGLKTETAVSAKHVALHLKLGAVVRS